MARPLGIAFQPQSAAQVDQQQSSDYGGGGSATPAQQAIQLLNLRLPTRAAPAGIAPQSLLQGAGGGGLGAGANTSSALERLKRLLGILGPSHAAGGQPDENFGADRGGNPMELAMRAMSQPQPSQAPAFPRTPTPRITVGTDPTTPPMRVPDPGMAPPQFPEWHEPFETPFGGGTY